MVPWCDLKCAIVGFSRYYLLAFFSMQNMKVRFLQGSEGHHQFAVFISFFFNLKNILIVALALYSTITPFEAFIISCI